MWKPAVDFRGLLISNFNVENFAAYLRSAADLGSSRIDVQVAPFNHVESILRDRQSSIWESDIDFTVIWSQPEAVLSSFRDSLELKQPDPLEIDRQVDGFAESIISACDRARITFVVDWVLPAFHAGQGMFNLSRFGPGRLLLRANQRLLDRLDGHTNILPLQSQRWFQTAGGTALNPRLWYLAKVPYSNEVFKEAARDVRSALLGLSGRARKLVVLDLDDTLWGGVVGEVGWQHLRLGGHDPVGEAFIDFQQQLKALTRRGIILGIASKNEENIALQAIEQHPEMQLRQTDFAGWRINWNDKAANILELAQQLNLGLDSVVFIDDNPSERARIRTALPDVLVPEWPQDPRLYTQALLRLDCFNTAVLSREDQNRTQMYVADRKRTELKKSLSSMEDWLAALRVTVCIEELDGSNLARAAQLLNKTNQFNLSTRRLTETELSDWASQPNRKFWTFRVADAFGDSGLTGLLSLECDGKRAVIEDFVLSCRVFGRHVERTMLHTAADWAHTTGIEEIVAAYKPTAKNKPCFDFLRNSGMRQSDDLVFTWDATSAFPDCPFIETIHRTAVSASPAPTGTTSTTVAT